MQSPSVGASGVERDTKPSRRLQRWGHGSAGRVPYLGNYKSQQARAAKVPRFPWTPRAEPLGKCSPDRSGNLRKLPGVSDPDTHWEMARAEAE